MQAIREPAGSRSPSAPTHASARASRVLRFPVWARRGAWAAAAMVLVAVGVFVITNSQTPALASLNDILGALGRPGDRTFRIHMEDAPDAEGQGPREDRGPQPPPRPGLDEATLYLRDGRLFLLVRADPKGGKAFDGYDGRQSWRIRASVLVETKDGPGAGGIPMPQVMGDVPFVDLQQTLERIRVDYSVERLDQAPLPSGGTLLRHVLARRNSREVKGPAAIEIWADSKTGMPRRIVFDQGKFQGNPQPRRLTFDLVSEAPLPVDWFTPVAHAAGKMGVGRQPTPGRAGACASPDDPAGPAGGRVGGAARPGVDE